MEQNEQEEWRQVVGFPRYQVSNQGRVRSMVNPRKPRILRPSTLDRGYQQVTLSEGEKWGEGKCISRRVHRIVAEAWVENPDDYPHIDHIDGNPMNNAASNLRWTTPKLNAHNPITEERRAAAIPIIIEQTSKMVLAYDMDFHLLSAFTSTADAARRLDLSQGNISNVCMGSLHSYKGLYFSFIPLYSQEDRDKVEEKARAKRDKRLKSVTKACQRRYASNIEKYRAYGREYYYRRKNAKNLHGGGSSSKK
jgi:hypothetical protein